jgi:hypothetical protein
MLLAGRDATSKMLSVVAPIAIESPAPNSPFRARNFVEGFFEKSKH